jgi:hypothetical protein
MTRSGGSDMRLVKDHAGFYLIDGTDWAIGLTQDYYEGPRGGNHSWWELRRRDGHGWCIDGTPPFRLLREAWAWVREHPEVVGRVA